MKLRLAKSVWVLGVAYAWLGAAGVGAQTAAPEPSTERTASPYDTNPACRERTVAGTDPACVIQDGPPLTRQFGFGFNSTQPRPVPAPPQAVQENAPPVIVVVPPVESGKR